MYASKRSVRKAQGLDSERPVVRSNNKGNKRGRGYYKQAVIDKSGKVIKTIIHVLSHGDDAWKPARKRARLRKSMANQPRG